MQLTTVVISSVFVLVMAALSEACQCAQPKHPQEMFCRSDFVIRAYVVNMTEDMMIYSRIYEVNILDILKEPEHGILSGDKENNDKYKPSGKKNKVTKERPTTAAGYMTDVTKERPTTAAGYMTDVTKERPTTAAGYMTEEPQTTTVLYTSIWGSMCGLSLDQGRIYILGGSVVGDSLTVGLCGLHVLDEADTLNKRQRAGFYHKYQNNCDCAIRYCEGERCPPVSSDQCAVDPALIFQDFMDCANRYSMCKRRDGRCQWTNNRYHDLCKNRAMRRRYYKQ